MVPLSLWKYILKVLPRFHFEYFSNIPLIAGASIIVEMYLDGCAARMCCVFQIYHLQTAHLIEELHHEGFVAILYTEQSGAFSFDHSFIVLSHPWFHIFLF